MGGKIESDANMSNQRINLNKLTGDLLTHYLHSGPLPSHLYIQYHSENSVKYIFIENMYFIVKFYRWDCLFVENII